MTDHPESYIPSKQKTGKKKKKEMLQLFSVTMLLQKYLHHYSETIIYII